MKSACERVIPYWNDTICKQMKQGKKILVVAHENVLRGIVQTLTPMKEEDLIKFEIPNATPFVYEFD